MAPIQLPAWACRGAEGRSSAKCGKFVKFFIHGTEVLCMIQHGFHHNTLKDIWPILVLGLVF
jgi:hypothetical protein